MASAHRITEALGTIQHWEVPLHAVAAVDATGTVRRFGDADRVVRIASVSKLLFAYAVLIAIEEGTVALDDPVGPIGSTVRHLLAHASGLGFEAKDPATAPGTRRIYSNAGFDLLGDYLTERSGLHPAAYLHAGVFEPLEMTATTLQGSVARDVHSSVNDLARFAHELLRPTLISAETLRDATTPQFADLGGVLPDFGVQRPCPWGLGLEVRGHKEPHWTGRSNDPSTFGHFGATGSFLWADPKAQVSLVCLTGRAFGPWAKPLWPALSDAVLAAFSSE